MKRARNIRDKNNYLMHAVQENKMKEEIRQVLMSGAGQVEAALASFPLKHDPASRAPGQIRRSFRAQQAKLDHRPLPFGGLCVPEVTRENPIYSS